MKKNLKLLISSAFIALACPMLQALHGAESYDDKRPHEHFCPITLEVMKDPVVAADGHSYEKAAIEQYLGTSSRPVSPLTGAPLKSVGLIGNQALKTMITDWKPGRDSVPSVLEGRDAASIAVRVKEEFNKNAALLNAAQGRHIVAFLGNTGAGKSTLVNWLAGKELKVSEDEEDYVLVNPADPTAMTIGTSGHSETFYPKFIDVGEFRFFDLPGFNDTDGSERNLVNAAFIRKILLDAASVRLVLVAGQDQFTADRSTSVRQMFNCLKQLFVVGSGSGLIDDNSVFVATKVTCAPKVEITDFLLKKTNSSDKAELNKQLKSWSENNRIGRMFHPMRDDSNEGLKEQILDLIQNTNAANIQGINVSALYPPETRQDLERMFLNVLEVALTHKLSKHPVTLSDYDQVIRYYTAAKFWQQFDEDICQEDDTLGLLKDFCSMPYTKALRNLEESNQEKLRMHIEGLRHKRHERVNDLEKRTAERANQVISSLVLAKTGDHYVTFDFAYHRKFYDQVCGAQTINQLATDPLEQEVVRSSYAGLISQHSHNQMMRWHERFSGFEELKKQLEVSKEKEKSVQEMERWELKDGLAIAHQTISDLKEQLEATQKKLYVLVEEPLIKAREAEIAERRAAAEAEQQRIQRERAAEAEQQRIQRERAAEAERRGIQAQQAAEAERQRIMRQEAEQRQRVEREKVALLSPSIDTTIQHIKDLQAYKLTYGELVKVLEAMDEFYRAEGESELQVNWCDVICGGVATYSDLYSEVSYNALSRKRATHRAADHAQVIVLQLLKKDVEEKMEKYQRLSGHPHPRRDEVNKL